MCFSNQRVEQLPEYQSEMERKYIYIYIYTPSTRKGSHAESKASHGRK